MQCVYLNGKLLPPDQALISPFDRGFIFGDGVYEVIPVYGGRLFRLKQHLQRLENSLNAISLKNPMRAEAWEAVFIRLIKENARGYTAGNLQVNGQIAARVFLYQADENRFPRLCTHRVRKTDGIKAIFQSLQVLLQSE